VNLKPRKRCGSGLLAGLGFFLIPISTAHAHLTVEGVGEVANGALHPLMTPAHVLVILSLGLLVGQQVPLDLKSPMRIFAPASAVALLLTLGGWVGEVDQPVAVEVALLAAALVALEIKIPAWVGGGLCVAAAFAIGLDSAVDTGSTTSVLKTLAGTWLSLNAAVFYIAVCASNAEDRKWARIGIRVLGSWIIAIALMVLAFSLRKSS
jgi:urease accessory protein